MLCPRCAKEIPDTETICPYCMQEIDTNLEFNDFREDGFVQIKSKDGSKSSASVNYKPKYFDISEYKMFTAAILFVLAVSVFTIFSLRFVQNEQTPYVEKYHSTEQPTEESTEEHTEETTAKKIVNKVKKVTIKNLYGSWKVSSAEETDYTAIPYFTFSEGGYLQENYGTIVAKGTYKDLTEKGQPGVYISIDARIRGAYNFDVTGNDDDGYTLTLTDKESGIVYVFVQAQAQMKKLGTIPEYKLDKRLLGTWYTKDRKKAYKFVKNGRMKRRDDSITFYGVWTVDVKGEVVVKYMKDEIKTASSLYKVSKDGKRIRINDILYYKEK